MHCRSCEILLEKNISHIEGVKKVEVSYKKGIAEVEFIHAAANDAAIAKVVNEAGYSLGRGGKLPWLDAERHVLQSMYRRGQWARRRLWRTPGRSWRIRRRFLRCRRRAGKHRLVALSDPFHLGKARRLLPRIGE